LKWRTMVKVMVVEVVIKTWRGGAHLELVNEDGNGVELVVCVLRVRHDERRADVQRSELAVCLFAEGGWWYGTGAALSRLRLRRRGRQAGESGGRG
jgi:hypothetical protein